jgi:hypothetical protein
LRTLRFCQTVAFAAGCSALGGRATSVSRRLAAPHRIAATLGAAAAVGEPGGAART